MAGKIQFKEEKAFKTLLMLDTIRGVDSTGIAYVDDDGGVSVVKAPIPAPEFIRSGYYERFNRANKRVIIGHNRAATKGKVNYKNAHPFEFEHIVGAHNGTLREYSALKSDHEVDSEKLFYALDKHGPEEVIPQISGAWALTWFDSRNHTINFLHNGERDFHYTFSEDEATIFWASEDWMLEVALSREGIKHKTIQSIKHDIWYALPIDFSCNKSAMKALAVPKGVAVEGKKFQSTKSYTSIHGKTSKTTNTTTPTGSTKPSTNTFEGMVKRLDETVTVRVTSLIHDGQAALCFEPGNSDEFILYNGPHYKLEDILGKRIKARIKKLHRKNDVIKFHLYASSVEVFEPPVVVNLTDRPVVSINMAYDHQYKPVSHEQWNQRYSNCSMCTCDLAYGEYGRIISYDEILCESCLHQNLAKMGV